MLRLLVRPLSSIAALTVAAAIALAGCGDDGTEKVEGPPPAAPDRIELISPAFEEGGTIPTLYTCDGADLSPPLIWRRLPAGTRSTAMLLEDPDAGGGTVVHWSWFRNGRFANGVGEGQVPLRARQGENSFGREFYRGPCPPEGDKPHRYQFAIYALRDRPDLEQGSSPEAFRDQIRDLATARGVLTGTFGR